MRGRVVVSCVVLICLLAVPAFAFDMTAPVTGFFSYVSGLFTYADDAPQVTDAFLNQYKFVPGDHMMITAHVKDDYGIDAVRAEIEHDAGVDVVNLVLVTGNEEEGTYLGQWVVHDCSAREYDARIIAVDSSGQEGYNVLVWEDPLVCNPGHQAEDVCPGVFGGNATGAGLKDYTFPSDVQIKGELDMSSNKIMNVALPTGNSDVASKEYVDALGGGSESYTCDEACKDYSMMKNQLYVYADCGDPVKRVFATSQLWKGNLGGLNGADAKCQAAADNAGLGGTWKAWLSTSTVDAKDRITDGMYVRAREVRVWGGCWCSSIIASNKAQLLDGGLDNSISRTEFGVAVSGTVNTCTDSDGTASTGAFMNYCSDWTSGSSSSCIIYGRSSSTDHTWSGFPNSCSPTYRCGTSRHVYCFEQ